MQQYQCALLNAVVDNEGSVDVTDSLAGDNTRKEHREKDFCCLRSSTPGKSICLSKTDFVFLNSIKNKRISSPHNNILLIYFNLLLFFFIFLVCYAA